MSELGDEEANSYAFSPVWSTDAQSIYYVSYRRLDADNGASSQQPSLDVALYRHDIAIGEDRFIAQDGTWPRPAPDGQGIVYIQVDPVTTERGIYTATADGDLVTEVVAINSFFDVDSPLYLSDGEWIYFSAVPYSTTASGSRTLGYSTLPNVMNRHLASGEKSPRLWWELLLNVKVARAHTDHNVPADWWRVPTQGGEPEKVTSMQRIVSYGEFTADGQQLFSVTSTGIYVIDKDGTVTERLPLHNLYRFVVWTELQKETS